MLVAPFDVRRRDRRAVMELDARPQPERRALGVLGELEAFGERRMVVELVAEVLDQAVVQRHQEIVGTGGAVVLLRIEPARRDVGVPGQHQLALWDDCRRRGRCARNGTASAVVANAPSSARVRRVSIAFFILSSLFERG